MAKDKKGRTRKGRGIGKWGRRFLLGLSVCALLGAGTAWWAWAKLCREAEQHLPLFTERVPPALTKVLDNKGNVIGILANQKRTLIPFDDIPLSFQGAIVAVEDADFWKHGGVSSRGVFGALYRAAKSFGNDRSGFSTLTMQLVRTVTEKRERNLLKGGAKRKIREIILARRLEKKFTKQEIMEKYSNEVNFGAGHYGIEAASQYYFRKSAAAMRIEESAMLAAMVQMPTRSHDRLFSTDPKEREIVRNRRNYVLSRMAAEGYLESADADYLKGRPIILMRENAGEEDVAAYAVEEVRKELLADAVLAKKLEPKYGKDWLMEAGLVIHTSIDSVWQQAATEAIQKGLLSVERRRGFRKEALRYYDNPETAKDPSWQRFYEKGDTARGIIMGWNDGKASVRMGKTTIEVLPKAFEWAGKQALTALTPGAAPLFIITDTNPDGTPKALEMEQVPEVEGALLAIDSHTGEIRAMVGGYNFRRSQFNRSTQAVRQVGSTMKAFVYGAALTEGFTPGQLVEDTPIMYQLVKEPPRKIELGKTHYQPRNYERNFWGTMTFHEALAHSRNIPAVRALEMAGISSAVKYAKGCGIESYIPPYPSLALGATDLTLSELTRGYATIAAGGYQCPKPFLIKRVVDRQGQVLKDYKPPMKQTEPNVDPVANFQLIQMLEAVTSSGTAGGTSRQLERSLAGKTGTTDDYTDAWFLGFSTRVTCGVWVGMDTKKTIHRGASGATTALPIWKDFMRNVLKTTPREDFLPPTGVPLEMIDLDVDTGLWAGTGTERRRTLAYRPGTSPMGSSDAEAVAKARSSRNRAAAIPLPVELRMWGEPVLRDMGDSEEHANTNTNTNTNSFDPNE